MSKIALESNINGSGVFTIASPNSNVDRTLTLPDWDGTLLTEENQSILASFRNKIINGNFDIWQRALSQTSSGYGSDDRWFNYNVGTTKTHSQQLFTLGQTDVPGNPRYFSRTVVSSVAGAANACFKTTHIENVKTLANKIVTLSFYAKADATKNIAVSFDQVFGTGGSPSTDVTGISPQLVQLTTSWQKFEITIQIPSILGKILGSDRNDFLGVDFFFDAGSNFASRAASLGQQSGTFDIAQVQLEEGSVATEFEDRPIGLELELCQRYFQVYFLGIFVASPNLYGVNTGSYSMRKTPVLSFSDVSAVNLNLTSTTQYNTGFSITIQASASGNGQWIANFYLDAEL